MNQLLQNSVTHPMLDVMTEGYRRPLTEAFVGEKVHLRVIDLDADRSDGRGNGQSGQGQMPSQFSQSLFQRAAFGFSARDFPSSTLPRVGLCFIFSLDWELSGSLLLFESLFPCFPLLLPLLLLR